MKPNKKKIVNEDHPNRGGSPFHYEPSNEGRTYLCQGGKGWTVGVFVSPEEDSEFRELMHNGLFRVKEKAEGEANFGGTKPYSFSKFKSVINKPSQPIEVSESKKVTISEDKLKKMIAESIKKRLNEVGDTFGGQFKLARLEARYKKAADKAESEGDYAKAEMLRARAKKIREKSDSEFEDSPNFQGAAEHFTSTDPYSDMWKAHGMAESKIKEAVRRAVKSTLNEMRKK